MSDQYKVKEHDVIVIGAGGAGLRAAIEASSQGVSVGLICKSLLGKAHTVMAEGGVAAALANTDDRDNWKVHFRDTMRGGKKLNHYRMAQLHAQEAPDRVRELEAWGAVFDRTADGRILQRNFGGHRYPRLAHVGDRTGLEMIRTLQQHGIHQGIEVFMEYTVVSLLRDGDRCAGALAYVRETGTFVVFRAKAVVMATGGIGKAWKVTSNSWEYSGDGHALAYQAGADLIDMEFMQFHPTGMVWPPSVRGTLITEGVRGEGGTLRNNKGERFMFKYIPEAFAKETAATEEEADRWLAGDKTARRTADLLTRDVVARAIHFEVKAGRGSPHGGAFLDIATRRKAEDIKRKLPSMYHQFKELADVDITKQPMEVGPTAHYIMGGIRVNPETQESTLPGLFAAGECAGGLHGANRLGGNSLSDLLVFGRRAGLYAAQSAKGRSGASKIEEGQIKDAMDRALSPFSRNEGPNPFEIHEELQEKMQALVGIIRTESDLAQAVTELDRLEALARRAKATGNRHYNVSWHECIDILNLITCARAVTICALHRKESRGGHTREDHPNLDDGHFGKVNTVVRLGKGGEMTLLETPLPEIPQDLQELLKD